MSVQNINISNQNIKGTCDLKCAYNFKYIESGSTATNAGVMINMTYDSGSTPPVTFNTKPFNVERVFIYSPSIHTFNDAKTDGELVIIHTPIYGGRPLAVGIPLVKSGTTTTATSLLTQVIDTVATNAPSKGNQTNLNISGFTLDAIVPSKPFYNYSTPKQEWIVFDTLDAVPLSESTFSKLTQIIKPFPLPTPGSALYHNESGPNTTTKGDSEIYISCQPTGSSEEETAVVYETNGTSYDSSAIFNDPNTKQVIQIIVGCLLFIIIFAGLGYLFSMLTSDAPKLEMPGFLKRAPATANA